MNTSFIIYLLLNSKGKQVQVQSNPHPQLTIGSSDRVIDPTQSRSLPPDAAPFSAKPCIVWKNVGAELEHRQKGDNIKL